MVLQEIQIEEAEVGMREQPEDQRRPELYPEPDIDILILPKDPEAEREGIHKRIQSEFNKKIRRRRLLSK